MVRVCITDQSRQGSTQSSKDDVLKTDNGCWTSAVGEAVTGFTAAANLWKPDQSRQGSTESMVVMVGVFFWSLCIADQSRQGSTQSSANMAGCSIVASSAKSARQTALDVGESVGLLRLQAFQSLSSELSSEARSWKPDQSRQGSTE